MPLDVYKKNMIVSFPRSRDRGGTWVDHGSLVFPGQAAYIAGPSFILCNGFSKMSLLAFYIQLSPHRCFRATIWATCGLVGCYTGVLAALMLFGCFPLRTFWDPAVVAGRCVDAHVLYMAIALSNIVSDVVLFIIPLPALYRLKLGRVKKIGAMMFFGVASL